jgi:arsenate reductase
LIEPAMSEFIIYHNPKCGTSRNALQGLRNGGVEPTIIEYLKNPPDRATLKKLIADMGVPVRDVVRAKEDLYKELGLDDPAVGDEQLIDAMLAHPILINRPIVVTPKGTLLVRPSERLAEIFP